VLSALRMQRIDFGKPCVEGALEATGKPSSLEAVRARRYRNMNGKIWLPSKKNHATFCDTENAMLLQARYEDVAFRCRECNRRSWQVASNLWNASLSYRLQWDHPRQQPPTTVTPPTQPIPVKGGGGEIKTK
jgi:hypothetical protein